MGNRIKKLVIILISMIFFASAANADQAEWTFLVYMAADNNLGELGFADSDLTEMKMIGSNKDVNVLVIYDGYDMNDSCYYFVEHGNLVTVQDKGELNTGDPEVLIDGANWAFTNYPAKRYALIFWNHGGGWRNKNKTDVFKSACSDDHSYDLLENDEIDDSLAAIRSTIGIDKIDLIGFDACLMQMLEIAYFMTDDGKVLVGSEELEGGYGWDYDEFLGQLVANPTMGPADLGTNIAKTFIEQPDLTQSAIDLSKISALADSVDSFAGAIMSSGGRDQSQIAGAGEATLEFAESYNMGYIDLYHFAQLVFEQDINHSLNTSATKVMNALEEAVIYHGHGYSDYQNEHGLSIYFPEYDVAYGYSDLDFAIDTQWDEMIEGQTIDSPNDQCKDYNVYSCDPSDPCNWADNQTCDQEACLELVGITFNDSDDCSGSNIDDDDDDDDEIGNYEIDIVDNDDDSDAGCGGF